jgi:hypothetical protein
LSFFAKPHLGILKKARKKVGMAVRTELTWFSLPGYERKFLYQPGNLLAIFGSLFAAGIEAVF